MAIQVIHPRLLWGACERAAKRLSHNSRTGRRRPTRAAAVFCTSGQVKRTGTYELER